MPNKENQKKIEWFHKLRLNSWEVEILIVGFMLVILFQIPNTLAIQSDIVAFSTSMESMQSLMYSGGQALSLGVLKVCVHILMISFSIYIALRGFWVGILGLSSVYPKGINLKKLNYHEIFSKQIKKYNFSDFIVKIDHICSSIFSFSFLLSFSFMSLIIFLYECILYLVLAAKISEATSELVFIDIILEIILILFALLGLFYFINYFLFGIFKKIKWKPFAIFFNWIDLFFKYATLVFFYEQLYYAIISNTKKRYFLAIIILYSIFYSFSTSHRNENYFFPNGYSSDLMSYYYYSDQWLERDNYDENIFPNYPFINSDIITSNYLKLYIPYNPKINKSLMKFCPDIVSINSDAADIKLDLVDGFGASWGDNSRKNDSKYEDEVQKVIDCINNAYIITINEEKIENDFIFYNFSHPLYNVDTFFMLIPLKDFNDGKHALYINQNFDGLLDIEAGLEHGSLEVETQSVIDDVIPFYIVRD